MNGLAPKVNQRAERRLFETTTTAVRLDAFDQDSFADSMERASRGSDSVIDLVQGVMNLLAGVVSLCAVAVVVIHPLLLVALLVATAPNGYAALRAGHVVPDVSGEFGAPGHTGGLVLPRLTAMTVRRTTGGLGSSPSRSTYIG
jgi:hypothetical protein